MMRSGLRGHAAQLVVLTTFWGSRWVNLPAKAYPSGSGPTMGSDKGGRLG